jgi:hypothetical protein
MNLRLFHLFVRIILSVTSTNCKSDSEILNEKSRKLLNTYKNERLPSYKNLYKKVTLQRNNYPAQVLVADSLFQSLEKINSLLDSLSFVIEKTDSTGERLDIGVNLLVRTPAGIRVSEESFTVYQYCVKGLFDKIKQKNIDERLSSFRYLGTPEFNEVYF